MKTLALALSMALFVSIAWAEAKPVAIGSISYIDKTTLVVADRKFSLPNTYPVLSQKGRKLSAVSLRVNQQVAVYATSATPFSQPIVDKIVLRRKP